MGPGERAGAGAADGWSAETAAAGGAGVAGVVEGSPAAAAARGRPMSPQTEEAIVEATVALLSERPLSQISIEDVAARARVSKASIYRRWSSKGALAFHAFMTRFRDVQAEPDTGRFEDDLAAALRKWVQAVQGTTTGRILRALIAEVQRDPELAAAWRDRFFCPVRDSQRVIVERAVARGEIGAGNDSDLLLDLLYGPAYHRLLQGHLPLDEAFVAGVARAVAAAAGAR